MNKRLTTCILIVLSLIGSTSFAQPTLTANGVNAQLGESFTAYAGAYLSPGGSGANQNWNYSALAGSNGEAYSVVAPSTTTNSGSFPNANAAMTNPGGTTARYFKYTSTAMENHGTFASNVVIPFTDAEDMLHYPFTFGNTFTDTWSGVYTTSYTLYRRGTTTVTADAYGTMVTPAGTFTNCLRVHFVQAYQDSFNFGSPFVYTYDNDQYMWYQEGQHIIVATTSALTSSTGINFTSAGYYSAGPVGTGPATEPLQSAALYPNPATDQVTLALDMAAHQSVKVQIFNGAGQLVQTLAPTALERGLNELAMAIDQLPNGAYYAKIMTDDRVASTKKFVVVR